MELEVWRYNGGPEATLGFLMHRGEETWELLCFVCEDQFQEVKVYGETRIPTGRYQIKLRDEGGMTVRYQNRYPEMHRGMLHLQDVPGFEYIYIHTGNDDDDSYGCLLVGDQRNESERTVSYSRMAYRRIYPRIANAIEGDGGCWITIRDLDRDLDRFT